MARRGAQEHWSDQEGRVELDHLRDLLGDSLAVSWTHVHDSEEFYRLADIRLRIVWVNHKEEVRECSTIPVLRTTATHSYIQMTRLNRAFIGVDACNRGKVFGFGQYRPDPHKFGHTVPCPMVYSAADIRCEDALKLLDQHLVEVDADTFQHPVLYRCSRDMSTLKPTEGDPMVDDLLGVAHEDTPEQWFYSHDVPEGTPALFDQLSEKDKERCEQHAHMEYLEDLHNAWERAMPGMMSTSFGYILPFRMVRTGGMVLCTKEEFDQLSDKWQIISRDEFRKLSTDNKWKIFI